MGVHGKGADGLAAFRRAKAAGIERIALIGIDVPTSRRAAVVSHSMNMAAATEKLDCEDGYPSCLWSAGVHPHSSHMFDDTIAKELRTLLLRGVQIGNALQRPSAVGEAGLDYFKSRGSKDTQARCFVTQIHLAREFSLPLIIHCREAYVDMLAVLHSELGAPTHSNEIRGVVHCFSSNTFAMESFIHLGFMISLAGPLTYPGKYNLQEVCRVCPIDALVIETDSPFLTPQPFRGKPNEPAFVTHVLEEAARIRNVKPDVLAAALWNNSNKLFNCSRPP